MNTSKDNKPSTILVMVQERKDQKAIRSKSLTVYNKTVEEVFNVVKHLIQKAK